MTTNNVTNPKAPTQQTFRSTGTTTGYLFTISTTSTCAVGDTYTNNSNTYTVLGALAAQTGQVLFCSGALAPTSTGTLTRSAGAGTASISFSLATALGTYTTPTGRVPLYLKIKMVGSGGGGSGSGTAAVGNGATGTASVFGANILIANGGFGGIFQNTGSSGGLASQVSPALGLAVTGNFGGGYSFEGTLNNALFSGAQGGNSPYFGGGGISSVPVTDGQAGIPNSGGGGQGGSSGQANSDYTGSGGGSGGFVDVIIPNPSATYVYAVGIGGVGGTAGTNGQAGGAGGSGLIFIVEYYQ